MANPSTANAHNQLISRLLANLPAGYTALKVKLPNRAFTTPTSAKWMRPAVIVTDSNNVQAGALWKRYNGLFVIDTFYPKGGDDILQLTEAETIAAVFENQAFNGVNCQDVLITTEAEETWYMCQIEINFYFEGI
jgi:hypothetical protein